MSMRTATLLYTVGILPLPCVLAHAMMGWIGVGAVLLAALLWLALLQALASIRLDVQLAALRPAQARAIRRILDAERRRGGPNA